MSMGRDSLENARAGIDVAGHNISNAQTEGYSRQRMLLEAKHPIEYGRQIFGTGADIQTIERVHDRYLAKQIVQESQVNDGLQAESEGLGRIETVFDPDLSVTIRNRITELNNALRDVSNYPEELAIRTNAVMALQALTESLNLSHNEIRQIQTDATLEIEGYISDINRKLSEVASLNEEITIMSAGNRSPANDLEDRRDLLLKELSELIDLNYYKDTRGQIVVRGPQDTLLVDGHYHVRLDLDNTGESKLPQVIMSNIEWKNYRNITDITHKGKIGGLLKVRDTYAQNILNSLDKLAYTYGNKFNDVHKMGYGINDYKDLKGRTVFSGLDNLEDASAKIKLSYEILNDPASLSTALTPSNSGDNIIVNELIRVSYEKMFDNGETDVGGFYDNIIGKLGSISAHKRNDSEASQIILDKLTQKRDSMSGVSLDEEAIELLKYQHLFAASSKIITTADEMMQTVLDLKR